MQANAHLQIKMVCQPHRFISIYNIIFLVIVISHFFFFFFLRSSIWYMELGQVCFVFVILVLPLNEPYVIYLSSCM